MWMLWSPTTPVVDFQSLKTLDSFYLLKLKPAARGHHFIREILDVIEQLILQQCPITGLENAPRLRHIVGDQAHLDLRVRPIDGCPCFRGLQAKALHAGDELTDNEFKVLLIALTGNIPCH